MFGVLLKVAGQHLRTSADEERSTCDRSRLIGVRTRQVCGSYLYDPSIVVRDGIRPWVQLLVFQEEFY